jgi:ABC-type multidrug transport system ATPase subunit
VQRKKAIGACKLVKYYHGRKVLDAIDLEVGEGECFCLLGPNGAGKTTTVKIITGFEKPDSGRIEVFGRDVGACPQYLKGMVNIIPQQPTLDPFLTVAENLVFYGMLQKIPGRVLRERVGKLLELFSLGNIRNQVTFHASGGEVQRLLVARAFLKPGDILFMDEPTSGIDILFKNKLWSIFNEMKKEGLTIFLNTHDLNEAEVLSDRIAFLFNGRILAVDTPQNLKRSINAEQPTLNDVFRKFGVEDAGDNLA